MSKSKSGDAINIPIEFLSDSDDDRNPENQEIRGEVRSPNKSEETQNPVTNESTSQIEQDEQEQDESLIDVGPVDDPEPEQESDPPQSALSGAEQQIATLRSEKQALYEQLLRRQAEFDNFRKRMERERLESADRAKADILKQLLPIADNFERALKHAPVRDDETNDGGLRAGVELIYKQLTDLLHRQGLEAIKAVGTPFDPHLHEAVTTTPTDEAAENTVLEELQRGYLYKGKLVRPATVRVAVKK